MFDELNPNLEGLGGAKLAATVLLLRDGESGIEVWVQERVSTMRNYPGITVFPGGGVDDRDYPEKTWDSGDLWAGPSVISMARRMGATKEKGHALVFAAVRELFEEAGLLLAIDCDGNTVDDANSYHVERLGLESHRLSLTDVLSDNNLRVNSDLLRPWARWVGPSNSGTWFDTFSFIAAVPEGQYPDGDCSEADSAGWFPPQLLLDGWRAGLVRFVIPTWAQLQELTNYHTVEEALAGAEFADMRPVIGDPVDDPKYRDFYTTKRIERIEYIPPHLRDD